MSRSVLTGIFCPHCGQQIELRIGYKHQRFLTAIKLQAARLGSEIHCDQCGNGFIYTRVGAKTNNHIGRPHLNMTTRRDRQYAAEPES